MSQTKLKKLQKIAIETRQWAQDYAKKHNFDPESLGEMCAIVSAELSCRLQKADFKKVTICETDCHCYILVKIKATDYLVDLTASQFSSWRPHKNSEKKIVIRPQTRFWPRPKKHYFWKNVVRTFKNAKDLLASQKATSWPKNQWVILPN